jgi:hypothetical protein
MAYEDEAYSQKHQRYTGDGRGQGHDFFKASETPPSPVENEEAERQLHRYGRSDGNE